MKKKPSKVAALRAMREERHEDGDGNASALARTTETRIASGDFRVPEHLDDDGLRSLHALAFVREGTDWATAAAVYAWTEPGQGKRTDLGGNPPKLTLTAFAELGLRGLGHRATVRKYRQAWEAAVALGIAEPACPGATVRLPKQDFEEVLGVHNHRAQGTGENEWYTPPQFVEMAREAMGGIDLDPASSDLAQEMVLAERYYTREDDGLGHEWSGRVWLNPPYAKDLIPKFVEKMVEEVSAGRTTEAVMLTHSYTDTEWFHRAESVAAAICFTRGRIAFISADGEKAAPTQGQAFFYYGSRPERFKEVFSHAGFVR